MQHIKHFYSNDLKIELLIVFPTHKTDAERNSSQFILSSFTHVMSSVTCLTFFCGEQRCVSRLVASVLRSVMLKAQSEPFMEENHMGLKQHDRTTCENDDRIEFCTALLQAYKALVVYAFLI